VGAMMTFYKVIIFNDTGNFLRGHRSMPRKKEKRPPKGKKRSVSFLASLALISLASFLIGVYVSQREHTRPTQVSRSEGAGKGLPERIIGDPDDHRSDQPKSLKPEELSFYKTLLTDSGRDRPGKIPANLLSPKTSRNSKTKVPQAKAETTRETRSDSLKNKRTYRIQLASFALRAEAERMKRDLSARGYTDPIIKSVVLSGKGTWYRVYVGQYGSYEVALKAEARIRSRERLATLVVLQRD